MHELYMTLAIAKPFSRRFWDCGTHRGPRLHASKAKLMCGVGVVGGVATCCTRTCVLGVPVRVSPRNQVNGVWGSLEGSVRSIGQVKFTFV